MSRPWKLFPIRLPEEYHGKPKPFRKLSEIAREKSNERENPQFVQRRIGHWQLKRSNADIERERKQFIVHPAKASEDSPAWFKTTYHYFDRNNYNSLNRGKILSHADGFNKTRDQSFRNTSCFAESRRVWREPPVTEKINSRDASLTGTRWMPMKGEVTPKVGSVEVRDYTIRRPQLKVGTKQVDNFINTYSVA